jgi:UDP-N-acetylmuramoyl-L-alanyl-D-glutamate--2,6-diaminopimelate ligase
MLLGQLISGLAIRVEAPAGGAGGEWSQIRITDITEDSRTVMPGSLFIARTGERSDGRAFASAAARAGAAAVLSEAPAPGLSLGPHDAVPAILTTDNLALITAQLAERFYGSPASKLAMIGVTGTNGKTTIAFLIHQLLNDLGMRTGMMGTVLIDDGTEVAPAQLTTPMALEVSLTLSRMVEAGCTACVMEASSHALDQCRVGAPGGARFRVGVFTNLTHDHLDYHGTMERYADAKAVLFAGLPDAGDRADQGGLAVINADDQWSGRMIRDTRARVVRCTMRTRHSAGEPVADWSARIIGGDLTGTQVEIFGPWRVPGSAGEPWRIRVPLIGTHNVMNALQAAAVVVGLGIDPARVREALGRVAAPPGRLEPVSPKESPLAVFVDYAHTDDALRRVLTLMRTTIATRGKGRLWCVFGCGGDRDRTKRPKMGAVAAELSDVAIITSDNPRRENPRMIIDEILAGVRPELRPRVVIEEDRALAIARAVAGAGEGDMVLIAGKGHEEYQIVPDGKGSTIKKDFSDRQEARKALIARGIVPDEHAPAVHVTARHTLAQAAAHARAHAPVQRTRPHGHGPTDATERTSGDGGGPA